MNRSRRFGVVAAVLAVATIAVVSRRHTSPPTPTEPTQPPPAIDVAKVIHNVHFAFRVDAQSGELEGGDVHYRTLVDETGASLRAYSPGSLTSEKLTLTTTSIRRGRGPELAIPTPEAVLRADGVATRVHWTIVETYRNEERGTEQTFELAERPTGEGPLVVRVAVAGMDYRGASPQGLHFFDEVSGLGFRYGTATFVDANDRRTEVVARFDGSAIELSVPADVLDDAAYPAVLDPLISPEIALDTPIIGNAWGQQFEPGVAFDGTNFVVVFVDRRVGFGNNDVMAARVAPDGTVLDSSGFVVANTFANEGPSLIACTATQRCLISYGDATISASRTVIVDTALPAVLAITLNTVTIATKNKSVQAIASDGTNYIVAWTEIAAGNNNNARGARIDGTTGALLDAGGFDIGVTNRPEGAGGITCNGTNCVVLWTDYDNNAMVSSVMMSRFSSAASPPTMLDAIVVNSTSAAPIPAIGRSGTTLGVAWRDSTYNTVYERRYNSTNMQALDAAEVPVITAASGIIWRWSWAGGPGGFASAVIVNSGQMPPAPPNTAGQALISLVDGATGAVTTGANPPGGASGLTTLSGVALTSNATKFLFAFPTGDAQSTGEIAGTFFAPGASGPDFEPPVYLSRSANDEREGRVAAGNDVFLVAWVDQRRSSVLGTGYEGTLWSEVYAARVRISDGVALDPNGIHISNTTGTHGAPDVGFDGTRFLVVYHQSALTCQTCASNYNVVGRRVDPMTGAVSDSTPISIALSANFEIDPAVCGDNGKFYVAWTSSGHIVARPITGSTGAIGASVQASPATSSQSHPRVTCAAGQSMLVWQDDKAYFGTPSSDVFARRYDLAAGTYTDALPGITVSALGPSIERYPVVTRIGNKFVIAWEDNRQGTYHTYAARIDATTGMLDDANGIVVSSGAVGQADVGITSDGQAAIAVFRDDGAAATPDVFAVRIAEDGTILDPTPVAIANSATIEGEPTIAANRYGHMLVAYTRFVTDPGYGAARVRAKTVFYLRPDGMTCGEDNDCQNGDCEDGVCCATDCGGSNPTDCRACSIAAGAAANGTCGTVTDTAYVCRPSAGGCDVAETCNGTMNTCPTDVMMQCDAGVPDAAIDAPPDAPPDAAVDARIDAAPDAAIDAPMIDAPMIDAPMIDAPVIDAPVADAAVIDAPESVIDAPTATPDAPTPPGGGGGGCSCETTTTTNRSTFVLWLVVGLTLLRRRRLRGRGPR